MIRRPRSELFLTTCEVPEIFLRLAKFYHLEPKCLADGALVYDFCCDPPHELILVSRDGAEDQTTDRTDNPPPHR